MSDQATTQTAERIAAGGRDALSARLYAAFVEEARAAGLDVGAEQLSTLVAAAAERADPVLWRRALADAACTELGVTLAEAVAHPAVERAHELVGAPPWSPPPPDTTTDDAPADDAPAEDAPDNGAPRRRLSPSRSSATPTSAPLRREARDTPGGRPGRSAVDTAEEERQALRLAAVHLGGIETVRPGDRDIELRLSPAGLDVLRRSSGAAIGRLEWHEIRTVELPRARRGLRPGRRRVQELHVATERGQASFELPGLTDEQVHEHLEPMLDRQGVARAQP